MLVQQSHLSLSLNSRADPKPPDDEGAAGMASKCATVQIGHGYGRGNSLKYGEARKAGTIYRVKVDFDKTFDVDPQDQRFPDRAIPSREPVASATLATGGWGRCLRDACWGGSVAR